MSKVFKTLVGTTYLPLHEVLWWISNTLEPLIDSDPECSRLEKQTLIGKSGSHWLVEPLNTHDWEFLNAAWSELPPAKEMTPMTRWKYSEALDLAKEKAGTAAPAWSLQVHFKDVRQESLDRQRRIYAKHEDQIDLILRTGEMKWLTVDRIPALSVEQNITLAIGSVVSYLQNANFRCEFIEVIPSLPVTPDASGEKEEMSIPMRRTIVARKKRVDLLTPVIEKARLQCTDGYSAAEVWPKLVAMAVRAIPPLIGFTDGEGVKWQDAEGAVKFIKVAGLRDRLKRREKSDSLPPA